MKREGKVMNRTDAGVVLDSYLISRRFYNGSDYLAGYAKIEKSKCEISNFISPTLRILHFLKGTSDWLIDGQIFRIHAEDIVILSNVCKRNIHEVLDGTLIYEMFDFYPSVFNHSSQWKIFFTKHHIIARDRDPSAASIYTYLDLLRQEMNAEVEPLGCRESIRMLLNLTATEFCRRLGTDSIAMVQNSVYLLSESIQYISTNLTDMLSVEAIAEKYGYTAEHYSRLFKRCFGITPMQYIINSRLDHALHLMKNEGMTVQAAAYRSGFNNASAFYRAFKIYKGGSPGTYITED